VGYIAASDGVSGRQERERGNDRYSARKERDLDEDRKFWEELIVCFSFTSYWVFDTTRTV
jgi:hypothetical protein